MTDAEIEAGLRRVRALTRKADRNRKSAELAIAERTALVAELRAGGVRLAEIARTAGVTHGALQWCENAEVTS